MACVLLSFHSTAAAAAARTLCISSMSSSLQHVAPEGTAHTEHTSADAQVEVQADPIALMLLLTNKPHSAATDGVELCMALYHVQLTAMA
jgi:hypothetical protein